MLNTTAINNVNSGKNNLKHALNYLLHLFMILGGLFKSPNILNIIYDQKLSPRGYDYMKSNRIGHNLIINGISYTILFDFKSKKFALLTLWQLLKLIYGHNEIVKFYDTIKSGKYNNYKSHGLRNGNRNILFEFKSKNFALITLWQFLKLIYCQNEIAKIYDTIKSGIYNNYKSLGLSNDNRNALSIKNELEFTNSYIICLMDRVHKFKKNINSQYDSIGSIPVFLYIQTFY